MKFLRTLLVTVLLSAAAFAQDAGKIFVVRHAEKVSEADDALLSAKGKTRAECLAQTLRDAGIKTVIVTNFERTLQTAEPLINDTHAKTLTFDSKAYDQITAAANSAAKSGNVLVVGHSNTIPALMATFHTPQVTIAGNDQLFLFSADKPSQLTTLHFCPNLPKDAQSPNPMMKP
jgi:phosphohistidine phosphatase SixA